MRVTVNGQPRDVEPASTVRQLVEGRGLSLQKVAVEVNRRLLKSERYDLPLSEMDEVEIVTFVGGG